MSTCDRCEREVSERSHAGVMTPPPGLVVTPRVHDSDVSRIRISNQYPRRVRLQQTNWPSSTYDIRYGILRVLLLSSCMAMISSYADNFLKQSLRGIHMFVHADDIIGAGVNGSFYLPYSYRNRPNFYQYIKKNRLGEQVKL